MSYESRTWSCGHDHKECDGHCSPVAKPIDCSVCGSDTMVCECDPPTQQATLEQVARVLIDSLDRDYTKPDGSWRDYQETVQFATQYLAAQRAAGLEVAAREARRRDRGAHKELYWLAEWLNAQAREQRP